MPSFDGGAPVWSRLLKGDGDAPMPAQRQGWTLPPGVQPLPPPEGSLPGCPLPYDWDRRRYCAFDVETTGLDARQDRIVEIGLMPFHFDQEGALVLEEGWGSLVNPGMPIPASSSAIHGIYDLEVSEAPPFSALGEKIKAFLGSRVMVAHNAMFDLGFLREELTRQGSAAWDGEIVDTLALARLSYPSQVSHALGRLAFALGIETGNSHRALDDAKTCMRVFALCARRLAGACP